jgi:hypothetical protein
LETPKTPHGVADELVEDAVVVEDVHHEVKYRSASRPLRARRLLVRFAGADVGEEMVTSDARRPGYPASLLSIYSVDF